MMSARPLGEVICGGTHGEVESVDLIEVESTSLRFVDYNRGWISIIEVRSFELRLD